MSKKKRRNYLKEPRLIAAIHYTNSKYIDAIKFREVKPVHIDGVKEGYTVDSFGNVFGLNGKVMNPTLINSGYFTYRLATTDPTKIKNITAHRLIKQTFDPVENMNQLTINHIDMNTNNNSLDNLEWVTQKENNDKKYEIIPNDGSYNYQSKFSYEQLKIIVDGLDKGLKYKEILSNIGLENTDNNQDYIGNIKRGITYKRQVEEIRNEKFND